MTVWTADQLDKIEQNQDLFVAPFREDGTTYGTLTQTWALVVDGKVYVRAANGQDSRWYHRRGRDRRRLRGQVPRQLRGADDAGRRPEVGGGPHLATLITVLTPAFPSSAPSPSLTLAPISRAPTRKKP
jgi:hypothetical protein